MDLIIDDFKNIPLDDNQRFEKKYQIDNILAKSSMELGRDIEKEFPEIIARSSVFYRPKTHSIIGAYNNQLMEINQNHVNAILEKFHEYVKKFIEDGTTKAHTSEEWFNLLSYGCKINMLGSKVFFQEHINGIIRQLLKANMDLSQKNYDETIKGFMKFVIAMKPYLNKEGKVRGTSYDINNGRYTSFMIHKYISDFVKDDVINYELIKMMDLRKNMSEEEFSSLYIDRNLVPTIDLIKDTVLSGKAKDEREAIEYLLRNHKTVFFNGLDSDEAIMVLLSMKVENSKDKEKLLKKIDMKSIEELSPSNLIGFLELNLPTRNASYLTTYPKLGKGLYFKKEFIQDLTREKKMRLFNRMILRNTIKYRNPLTSEELVDMYDGNIDEENKNSDKTKGLRFLDISLLCANGWIQPQDVIKVNQFKYSIEDDRKKLDHYFNLTNFYTIERLNSMRENGQMNGRFVENYNTFINELDQTLEKKYYFDKLKDELEKTENKEEVYINLLKAGLNLDIKMQLTPQIVSDLYLEEKCTDEDIVMLYQKGIVLPEVLKEILTDEQIITKVCDGEIDYHALNLIGERTLNLGILLEEGKIDLSQLIGLYSIDNGLTIEELRYISEIVSFGDTNIAELLPDDITVEKVEQLTKNWLISQDDLSSLVERKIITQEKANKLAEEIESHDIYMKFFGNNAGVIQLTNETESREASPVYHERKHSSRERMIKNSPQLQEELFRRLSFDNQGDILLRGRNNSLDGYRIFSSEELGVVSFIKNDEPGNATYVMSVPQAAFTIDKIEREDRIVAEKLKQGEVFARSDATKKGIRETEHVKIINASRNWGRNMLEAMRQVSKKAREKIGDYSRYNHDINVLLLEIQRDYDRRKNDE